MAVADIDYALRLLCQRPLGAPVAYASAQLLGVSVSAVSHWRKVGYVPPAMAARLEELTGVDRHRLLDPELVDLVCPKRRCPGRSAVR